ncbi:beta strand repeat-containing protein [Pseudomonas sp. DSP3-2-2]|uniref:beta strand repeat-containing protein n=1 Tax=unclassified Pseudomonas TaxID=196821 RepID=UPI003CF57C56
MAASTYFDQIQQLYIAYFGRPADPVGLAYWAANVDAANGSVAQVIAGFSASTESGVLYAGATTAQKVSSIYLALFNRNPEPAGLAYWVAQIDSGTVNPAQAAYQIQTSAGPGDATSVANKLAAAKAFTAQIDTSAELAGYVGTTAASSGRAFLNGVDATPASLVAATSTTTLATSVATATNTTTTPPVTPVTPATGQTFTLTAGADNFTGTSFNDTFTSTLVGGFGTGDVLDGGAGIDTLTVSGTSAISSAGLKVANVESASFTSSGSVDLDTSSWTGLTSLTAQSSKSPMEILAGTATAVTATALINGANTIVVNGGSTVSVIASGSTTGSITVGSTLAPTGTVTVSNSSSAAGSMGATTVKGGTAVKVAQIASNAVNTETELGSVTVTGTAVTTTVDITNTALATASGSAAGVITNSVTITDVNSGSATLVGTISNVAVSNVTNITISGTALTHLSVKGGVGNIITSNSGLSVPVVTTLNLTLDGQSGGSLIDAGIYSTLNLTTTGSDSTLTNIFEGGITTLNLAGTQALTLASATGLSSLTSLKVSGSAGLTADLSKITKLTSIDASATSGNVTVSIDSTKASYLGGSGIDTVTLTGMASQTINGGAGTADVLKVSATNAATLNSAALVSGFEEVVFSGSTNQTINTSNFVGATQFTTSGGNGQTLSNMVSGSTLQLTGAGTRYVVDGAGFAIGTNDILNMKLTDKSTAGVQFASTGINAVNVENIAITVTDAQANPTGTFNDFLTLQGNSVNTITVAGNAGLTLTATSTALTSVDASGITKGGFTWTSGSLANAITVKGSEAGTNNINLSGVSAAVVNYTGGSGNNVLTTGNGNDIVTLGNSAGTNIIIFGSGTDKLVLAGIATTKAAYTQTTGLGIGDSIDFSGAKGAAINSVQANLGAKLTGQASLDNYLDAATTTSVTAGASAVLNWFQFGGNTYIVQDTSANSVFTAGADSVVMLSGTIELSGSSVTAGVVAMNPV